MARSFGKPVDITGPEPKFPEYTGRKFKPIGARVHVQLDHFDMESGAGLLVSGIDKKTAALSQGKILAVGPEASDLEIGAIVIIAQHHGSGNAGEVRKDGTMLIDRKFILAVVERS